MIVVKVETVAMVAEVVVVMIVAKVTIVGILAIVAIFRTVLIARTTAIINIIYGNINNDFETVAVSWRLNNFQSCYIN